MTLDPSLVFWSAALANLAVILALCATGVAAIRRGEVRKHRRRMVAACGLVVLFLVSYVAKVRFLGREDLDAWSAASRNVLHIHEACVLLMVIAGGVAFTRAMRFRRTLPPDGLLPARERRLAARAAHRRAGWTAVAGAVLGFATATLVLLGMFARA